MLRSLNVSPGKIANLLLRRVEEINDGLLVTTDEDKRVIDNDCDKSIINIYSF